MGRSLETLGPSIDGQKSRTEVFSLLSEARLKFALATRATALPPPSNDVGIEAGYSIFHSTYSALSYNKWEGRLPYFYELPDDDPSEFVEAYGGTPTSQPLLSNPRARAAQLLVVGGELLERQIKKIGKPPQTKIFLHDN